MTDPMITAANTLEASPKPSYGPHKANERYLDDEDRRKMASLNVTLANDRYRIADQNPNGETVDALLEALEILRTHLRKKYYGG